MNATTTFESVTGSDVTTQGTNDVATNGSKCETMDVNDDHRHRSDEQEEKNDDSSDQEKDVGPSVGDDSWEEHGCVLWDLATSRTHAELMVQNLVLEVILATLTVSQSPRVTTNSMLVLKEFRLITLGVQGSEVLTWVRALQPENVLSRILWVVENTLNPQLLEKSVGFLLSVSESQDEVRDIILPQLVKLGLPIILIGLLATEISKLEGDERLPERYPVLDVILRAIEALSVIDSCSQELCSSKKLLHLLATLIKLTDKIEVAASCVTAAVLIANLLSDSDGLILEINKDQLFLQGLLDIFPFASDDIEARNAIWDVISRQLAQVQEGETSPLKLHQYVSVLASKSDLIEEELLDHQLAASNKDQENSTTSSRNLHIRTAALKRIDSIVIQWLTSKDQDSPINVTEDYLVNERDLDRLKDCCQKYSK
ncbi:protein SAAL [Tanacetum coccineum]|uniref:Protein SAAL n=1 Tax=Tanacetum coccineum TaxID=301880 RepID=A0ABQ5IG29_9ASTR